MTLRFYDNLRVRSYADLTSALDRISRLPVPGFVPGHPPFNMISQKSFMYSRMKNILIIAYGGSNTSFLALYGALRNPNLTKNVEVVNTVDPDELYRLRNTYTKRDTLVVAISKSGNTAGVLETLMYFHDYTTVVITEETDNALMNLAWRKQWDYLVHPEIGGRFSARTVTTYFPAALMGIDVEQVDYGFMNIYQQCNEQVPIPQNPAKLFAAACRVLEDMGYTEVYVPYYTPRLQGMANLIVQLMHESVCKHGRGQTFYTAYAPEAQHHTNQRIFGGRRNVISLFIRQEQYDHDQRILVQPEMVSIPYKDTTLSVFESLPFSYAMNFELQGTYETALNNGIPSALLSLERIDPMNMGELIGFFQYVAVYAGYLREVNPFDQPHVESSKKRTIELIKGFYQQNH